MDKNNNFRKELEFYWKGSRRINKLATVEADREQAEFFLRVHDKKHAPPEEFDMVLNMDKIVELNWAAESIAVLFQKRFENEAA